jgi:hypothetical protein
MNGLRKCGIYTHGILCSHEKEQNVIIRWKMDGIEEHHSE